MPNTNERAIAGALFDFLGFLTTRPERLILSSADDASAPCDALKEWADKRSLNLDEADVRGWRALAATAPNAGAPLTDVIEEMCARIKAADDAAADRDYMLDSDDCIKVLRGTWVAPLPLAPSDAAGADLLPCPFCAGSAHITFDALGLATNAWAKCLSCGASVYAESGCRAGAVTEWNRRATPPQALPLEPSDREQFSAAMVDGGWDAPATNGRGDAFLFERDEDRYVGWKLARATPPQATLPASEAVGKYDNVLRPFLALMERELYANSHKGDRPGWLSMSRSQASLEIYHHATKLANAMLAGNDELIKEHAADVANMAMMALDVCGGLATRAQPQADAAEPVAKGGAS